ncbi:uncharacterized protein LOC100824446 isoform X3 [Brachypodium distachyon]|uniref:uncharacterized protein LOC100824446 isoform X3 n=1 Tax=Brachypodium distachyon TaxID=15368 RepID=UPI00071D8B36|nr:uncharacterized protein LOC100824446 isoform X3 [Brachypodium distachyon]|eukprot:XP_014758015.1 uncharacterized protein LOC100824446 isoform X3 [Brachypodium distachyon]
MGKKGAPPTLTPKQEEPARVLTLIEVDPAKVDPAVLDAIRKKNSAALTSMFDPLCELSEKDSSNTADTVWYLVTNGNHATGNLNLLMDLVPVCDRWVRPLMGRGLPMQVCARGSVNCNGIKVNDVWYVPGVTANMVSIAHLTDQELTVSIGDGICSIKRPDGTELGKGRRKGHLYELDFINTISATPWYIVSNAAEHMTGNLHLLTNFTPTQPGRPIRTHTGAMLQRRVRSPWLCHHEELWRSEGWSKGWLRVPCWRAVVPARLPEDRAYCEHNFVRVTNQTYELL